MNLNNQHLHPEQRKLSQESLRPVLRRLQIVGDSTRLLDETPEIRSAKTRDFQRQQAASVALSDGVAVESAGQPASDNVIDLNSYREQRGVGQQAVEEAKLGVEEAYRGAA